MHFSLEHICRNKTDDDTRNKWNSEQDGLELHFINGVAIKNDTPCRVVSGVRKLFIVTKTFTSVQSREHTWRFAKNAVIWIIVSKVPGTLVAPKTRRTFTRKNISTSPDTTDEINLSVDTPSVAVVIFIFYYCLVCPGAPHHPWRRSR